MAPRVFSQATPGKIETAACERCFGPPVKIEDFDRPLDTIGRFSHLRKRVLAAWKNVFFIVVNGPGFEPPEGGGGGGRGCCHCGGGAPA